MAFEFPANDAAGPSGDSAFDLFDGPSDGSVLDSSSTAAHPADQNTPNVAPTTPVVTRNAGWSLASIAPRRGFWIPGGVGVGMYRWPL